MYLVRGTALWTISGRGPMSRGNYLGATFDSARERLMQSEWIRYLLISAMGLAPAMAWTVPGPCAQQGRCQVGDVSCCCATQGPAMSRRGVALHAAGAPSADAIPVRKCCSPSERSPRQDQASDDSASLRICACGCSRAEGPMGAPVETRRSTDDGSKFRTLIAVAIPADDVGIVVAATREFDAILSHDSANRRQARLGRWRN